VNLKDADLKLRSGARRSKWLGVLQPGPLPLRQGENWAQLAQNQIGHYHRGC